MYRNLKLYIAIILISFTAVQINSCAFNPATGERNLSLISESQEIQMGKEADQQITASMGIYNNTQLGSYVERLGKEMAAKSERPNLPWTFRVIDDPVVNAFALPGGYIYVTRGILSHLQNEAELTGVLGHEIGHVTAKHSVTRISEQQLTQIGLGVAVVLKPELQQYSQFAQLGLGLLFLKFSRDDEKQADELGLRYMVRTNDDPRQMASVMKMLQRVSQQSGGSAIPQWLSTHPDPANRIELINSKLGQMNVNYASTTVNQDEYLGKLDNMIFGDNPRDGYFVGNTFYHPDMKFSFVFPAGWKTINQKQAVIGISPKEDAIIQLAVTDKSTSEAAAESFFKQEGISPANRQQLSINGFASSRGNFTAQSDQGSLYGDATFITYGGKVYQVLSYTSQQLWNNYTGQIGSAVNTFNKVTDPNILNVKPQKIKIVKVDSDISVQDFYRRYPSVVPIETIALINQVNTGDRFTKGQLVKQVIQ